MVMKIKVLLFVLIAMVTQAVYSQTTVALTPVDDTQLGESAGPVALGAQSNLLIYPWAPSFSSRSVLKFDLSPFSGCVINSAWLVLFERNSFGSSRTIDAHSLTTDWSESSAHWNFPWSSAGGDFISTAEGSFTPVWTGVLKADSVDLTASVQNMVSGIVSNYGWVLKVDVEDASQQFWEFYSKEWTTAAERPVLKIAYSGCTPLPVELLDFNAVIENNKVKTSWITSSEINNDYFSIQRSQDANTFEQIGTMQGAGNSSTPLNYVYYDNNPNQGLSYYRLKQVDFNGSFVYSNIESVYMNPFSVINLYPNPAIGELNVLVGSPSDMVVEIEVINAIGEIVMHHQEEIVVGYNTIGLNTLRFSSGNYIFKITLPTGEHIEKEFIRK
ncbi:MAG: hypothetical protein COB15_06440 [Flavobacteriales bacterium]|nr:MAG: hypothetical protein COB15_06440 [Flavobacteriales bacterium]